MKVKIKKYGINGEGIAYIEKKPVFIPGVLVEEIADVRIDASYKNYKTAELKEIVKASPSRIKITCPFYQQCGACTLLHADYDEQLRIKKAILEESLAKYADIYADVDITPSPKKRHYRNALKLPVKRCTNKLTVGFYAQNSNRFISIEDCLNHDEELNLKLKEALLILNKYGIKDFDHHLKKGLRYIVIRVLGNMSSLSLIGGHDEYKKEMIDELVKHFQSISQSTNIAKNSKELFGSDIKYLSGKKDLHFHYADFALNISPKAFLQLNTSAAEKMYEYVYYLLEEGELLVEAYAGIGLMSFLAHNKFKEVVGIELDASAVKNANANARNNHLDNLRFVYGDAAEMLKLHFKNRHIDTLIVDPPRSGLDANMLENMLKAKINNIIYISCNSATLAKNLNILLKRYKIETIKAFDFFPNTQHVETVVLMSRVKGE